MVSTSRLKKTQRPPFLSFEADKQFPQKGYLVPFKLLAYEQGIHLLSSLLPQNLE